MYSAFRIRIFYFRYYFEMKNIYKRFPFLNEVNCGTLFRIEENHGVYNSLIYCYIFTVFPIVQFFLFTAQLCNSRTATLILFPSIFSYKIYCVRSAKPQTLHRLLFRMQNQRFTFNIRTRATFRE